MMERVAAVRSGSRLEHAPWAELLLMAVFTGNRLPASCGMATYFEVFDGKTPIVSMLRVSGSPIYALKPKRNQRNLQPKAQVGLLVGYGVVGKAYRVYVP